MLAYGGVPRPLEPWIVPALIVVLIVWIVVSIIFARIGGGDRYDGPPTDKL